jgi:hypothetical protein
LWAFLGKPIEGQENDDKIVNIWFIDLSMVVTLKKIFEDESRYAASLERA